MRYKLLGASGLRVSELGLGALTFGEEWGWGASPLESERMFDAFTEAGGNFIDTANRYTEGTSERLVGQFVARDRAFFVIGTKYTLCMDPNDPNSAGNHRKNMVQSLEGSLRRLQTDYVDLFWVHAWDFTTPVDEVMRGLDDLVGSGKVLHVGVSATPAWVVAQANTLAGLRGWSPFVGLQVRYSLVDRTAERDLLPMARAYNLGVMPWGVLGAGVLSGKYGGEEQSARGRARDNQAKVQRSLRIANEVVAVAKEIGCAASQVAISWVRNRPGAIIPLLGARSAEQLRQNLGALDVELVEDHLARLDAVSRADLGFPHDFLAEEATRARVYGLLADQLNPSPDR